MENEKKEFQIHLCNITNKDSNYEARVKVKCDEKEAVYLKRKKLSKIFTDEFLQELKEKNLVNYI